MKDAEKLDLRAQECQRALLTLQAEKKPPKKITLLEAIKLLKITVQILKIFLLFLF